MLRFGNIFIVSITLVILSTVESLAEPIPDIDCSQLLYRSGKLNRDVSLTAEQKIRMIARLFKKYARNIQSLANVLGCPISTFSDNSLDATIANSISRLPRHRPWGVLSYRLTQVCVAGFHAVYAAKDANNVRNCKTFDLSQVPYSRLGSMNAVLKYVAASVNKNPSQDSDLSPDSDQNTDADFIAVQSQNQETSSNSSALSQPLIVSQASLPPPANHTSDGEAIPGAGLSVDLTAIRTAIAEMNVFLNSTDAAPVAVIPNSVANVANETNKCHEVTQNPLAYAFYADEQIQMYKRENNGLMNTNAMLLWLDGIFSFYRVLLALYMPPEMREAHCDIRREAIAEKIERNLEKAQSNSIPADSVARNIIPFCDKFVLSMNQVQSILDHGGVAAGISARFPDSEATKSDPLYGWHPLRSDEENRKWCQHTSAYDNGGRVVEDHRIDFIVFGQILLGMYNPNVTIDPQTRKSAAPDLAMVNNADIDAANSAIAAAETEGRNGWVNANVVDYEAFLDPVIPPPTQEEAFEILNARTGLTKMVACTDFGTYIGADVIAFASQESSRYGSACMANTFSSAGRYGRIGIDYSRGYSPTIAEAWCYRIKQQLTDSTTANTTMEHILRVYRAVAQGCLGQITSQYYHLGLLAGSLPSDPPVVHAKIEDSSAIQLKLFSKGFKFGQPNDLPDTPAQLNEAYAWLDSNPAVDCSAVGCFGSECHAVPNSEHNGFKVSNLNPADFTSIEAFQAAINNNPGCAQVNCTDSQVTGSLRELCTKEFPDVAVAN